MFYINKSAAATEIRKMGKKGACVENTLKA